MARTYTHALTHAIKFTNSTVIVRIYGINIIKSSLNTYEIGIGLLQVFQMLNLQK